MISLHPRLGEDEGELGGTGFDLWEGSGDEAQNRGKIADERLTTEDNVGCLIV